LGSAHGVESKKRTTQHQIRFDTIVEALDVVDDPDAPFPASLDDYFTNSSGFLAPGFGTSSALWIVQ